jgi:transcriptional regulator with XRE-family HTH domain
VTNLPIGLSQQLRVARERAGYSLDDLAVTSGLTIDEIHEIECEINADPLLIRRIAAALGLSSLVPMGGSSKDE